ncbi:MAG: BLUF domain-containing protein [Tardiphaga sp.]
MFQIIYISTATVPFSAADLDALLQKARVRNESAALTGMMVYSQGEFLQALEGETAAVLETFARIEQDARHSDVVTLRRGPIPSGRMFETWSMGFKDVTDVGKAKGAVRINDRIVLSRFDEFSAADFLQACSQSQR